MLVKSSNLGILKKDEAAGSSFFTALFASIMAALLFLALCFVLHITPFGDKTFLYEDMKQQYVDFFSYYHNVWHGKDGFLFSENCGLGSGMFGIWAYYLMSPFLLMFAVLPAELYSTAVTFLIMMKISVMAFSMSLLLSHISKRYCEKEVLNIPLSVAFAFCGWTVSNMTNIMWLDAVILMPIVIIGFDRLMHREKHGWPLYIISVMAMVVVNYYIAAMVLIFLGVFAVLDVTLNVFFKGGDRAEETESKVRSFGRFIAGSAAALLLDLWFLIPTVISLLGSNKDHSEAMAEAFSKYLPSSEAIGRSLSPLSVLPKLFTMSYDTMEIMEGLPNIYFGVALLVPCILFFMNSRISARVRVLFGGFLAIVTAFFCVKPLNTLAHGGTEAYGYLYRYSFVFSFAAIIMVYLCMSNISGINAYKVIAAELITCAVIGIAAFSKVRFLSGKSLLVNALLVVTSGVVVALLSDSKGRVKQYALPVMGLILAADLSLNFICIYRNSSMNAETVSGYKAKYVRTELALEEIEEQESLEADGDMDGMAKNIYRVESLSPRTPNDSIQYGYRGTTTYNSLLKVENRLFMYKLGFNDNGLYTMYEAGNTRCADAILGVRYLITDDKASETNDDGSAKDTLENTGREFLTDVLIRNKYVLSADYVTADDIPELLKDIDTADNPFDAQEILWKKFTGSDSDVFVRNECESCDVSTDQAEDGLGGASESGEGDDPGSHIYKVTASEDGELYFYMNRDNTNERSLEIWCDGEFVSGYGNASCQKVIDLGYHTEGEEISLIIKEDDGLEGLPSEPVVVTEMIEALVKAVE